MRVGNATRGRQTPGEDRGSRRLVRIHATGQNYTGGMRGLIFTEFIALVEEKFGLAMSDDILSQPGLSDGGAYTSVGNYDHREMLTLVMTLADRSGLPADELCRIFGEWLFPKLARGFDFSVKPHRDAFSFLQSLDGVIHVEVRKLYPDANLPRVPVVRCDAHELVMEYRSERPFADVAEGLIRGCLAWFGERATLRREPLGADAARASLFTITRSGAPA